MKKRDRAPDVQVTNCGTIFTFSPLTKAGTRGLRELTHTEPWQWLGGTLAVEHRYAWDLAQGLSAQGYKVI